jgi:hypothetical protein
MSPTATWYKKYQDYYDKNILFRTKTALKLQLEYFLVPMHDQ